VTEVRDRRRIAASPREVWKVLSDFERYPAWGGWVRDVQRVDRPAGLGAAYDERSRLLAPLVVASRWRIIEFDAPLRQVHRAESAPLAAAYDRIFELASDGIGGTWLTLRLQYRPALGVVGRWGDRLLLRRTQTRRVPVMLEAIELLALRGAG
jgi:hypothetical protein